MYILLTSLGFGLAHGTGFDGILRFFIGLVLSFTFYFYATHRTLFIAFVSTVLIHTGKNLAAYVIRM